MSKSKKATNNQMGDERMSIIGTLKKKEIENDELTAQVADLGSKLKAACEQIEAQGTEAKRLAVENVDLLAAAEQKATAVKTVIADQDEQLKGLQGQMEEMQGELEKAQAALKHPAFADAGARGEENSAEDGAMPPEDATISLFEIYEGIKDPVERSRFWNKNEAAIKEEMRESARQDG